VFKIWVLVICSLIAIGSIPSAVARADSLQLMSDTSGVFDFIFLTITLDSFAQGNGIVLTGLGNVISAILASEALAIGCLGAGGTLSTIPGVCAVGSVDGFEVTSASAQAGPVNFIIKGVSTDTVSGPTAPGASVSEAPSLLLLGTGLLGLVGAWQRKGRWVGLLLRLKPRRRPTAGPASTRVGLQR
jgi:hypothetical protein